MKRNLKYIIPLLVVAGSAATSCNNGGGVAHLKRETFDEETTFKALADEYDEEGEIIPGKEGLLTKMRNRQFISPGSGEGEEYLHYNTPEKGKVTTNLNIALSGSIRILAYRASEPYHPELSLDLNNINILVNDKITTLWNMGDKDCGDYFSCKSKSGKSYFIEKGKDQTSQEDVWYKYYDTPIVIDGKKTKYRENVTSWINDDFANFKNFALYQLAASSGWFAHYGEPSEPKQYAGFGLGITGFGGDMIFGEKNPDDYTAVDNIFLPGAIDRLPAPFDYNNMGECIDALAENKNITNIIPITKQCTKGNDDKNISMAVDVKKFDFTKSQELVNEIIKEIEEELDPDEMIAVNGSGTGAIDYFSCFKNDWLHQFELTFDFNKVNLQFLYYDYDDYRGDASIVYINLKNFNAKAYLNETFEPDCGSYTKPSTEGYIDITPEEPEE